jgi:hypothetical protein
MPDLLQALSGLDLGFPNISQRFGVALATVPRGFIGNHLFVSYCSKMAPQVGYDLEGSAASLAEPGRVRAYKSLGDQMSQPVPGHRLGGKFVY